MTAGAGPRRPPGGLCDACRHQRLVRTGRGAEFSLCERHRVDPRLPKYPRLPVLRCHAFEPRDEGGTAGGDAAADA